MLTRPNLLIFLLLISQLFSAGTVSATPESRAAALFLLMMPGARTRGMGGTGTALANDGTAAYFNPAGLVNHELIAGELHTKSGWYDTRYWYLAGALNFNKMINENFKIGHLGAFGFSLAVLDLGDQMRTDERGNIMGSFNSRDLAISLTYANTLGPFSSGVSLKYIDSNLADMGAGIERGNGEASAFAIDLGFLFQGILGDDFSQINSELQTNFNLPELAQFRRFLGNRPPLGLSIGIALANAGPDMAYIDASQADPLPTHLRLGLAGNFIDTDLLGVQAAADLYKPLINDDAWIKRIFTAWADDSLRDELEEFDLHLGAEVTTGYVVTFRGGKSWDWDGEFKPWTLGCSIGPETARLNYAFSSEDSYSGKHFFSLSLNF
jgi:hypothetical protein